MTDINALEADIAERRVRLARTLDELTAKWAEDKRWEPQMAADERERNYRNWQKAVTKTPDWVDDDVS